MADHPHESLWPEIKTWAEAGHIEKIQDLITSRPNLKEQIVLGRFTVRGLKFRDWAGKNLKTLILLADQTIATALLAGEVEEANITCFNMSSNLAGCWQDGFVRTVEDYKKGQAYAERALEFRRQLKKGPASFALAYWGRGIHEYFLGDFAAAEESFRLSEVSAIEAAVAEGKPTGLSKDSTFHELIATGYRALAQTAQGQTEAAQIYEKVLVAFEDMKSISDDARQDAEIALSQLRRTHQHRSGEAGR
jgi:hypothetical protein